MRNQPLLFRPGILLRAEAMLVLFTACAAYQHWFPHHWILFACLFLVPDVSLLFSARGPGTIASAVYNSLHNYVLPLLLGVISFRRGGVMLEEVTLIWISHIAMDRMLGFGLKYPTSFKFTHIQSADNVGPLDAALSRSQD